MKTIVYQGMPGAYSHLAAIKTFGSGHHFHGLKTFHEMFLAMEEKQADMAVVPIENTLAGTIYENIDLLNTHEGRIVGECCMKIDHCLLGIPGTTLQGIQKVFSHAKALEQCTLFFKQHPWIEAVVHNDTAGAAAEIAAKGNAACGAIASSAAGDIYGLENLRMGIQDDCSNTTRFVLFTPAWDPQIKGDKCSLLMRLEHVPGSLANVLHHFVAKKLNLTKIQSRPLRGSLFEYVFYLDFEFAEEQAVEVAGFLDDLKNTVWELKILGLYHKDASWKI